MFLKTRFFAVENKRQKSTNRKSLHSQAVTSPSLPRPSVKRRSANLPSQCIERVFQIQSGLPPRLKDPEPRAPRPRSAPWQSLATSSSLKIHSSRPGSRLGSDAGCPAGASHIFLAARSKNKEREEKTQKEGKVKFDWLSAGLCRDAAGK